jgi:hypothetical protein
MKPPYFDYYDSQIGLIEVGGTESEILSVTFVDRRQPLYESQRAAPRV